MTEDGWRMTEDGDQKTDDGRQMTDGRRIGIRPPASPSCRLYEPEAAGAIGTYAPEGRGNAECGVSSEVQGTRCKAEGWTMVLSAIAFLL